MSKPRYFRLPCKIYRLCIAHDAWVIGSAAVALEDEDLGDVDIVFPYSTWPQACLAFPLDHITPNTFGGWKIDAFWAGIQVDAWPDDLGRLAKHPRFVGAWHPRSGKRIWAVE